VFFAVASSDGEEADQFSVLSFFLSFLPSATPVALSPVSANNHALPIGSMFFFGGMSIHLSTALLAHLFSYDM
jgi:hypothetical protein